MRINELEDKVVEEVELEDVAPKRVIAGEPVVKPTSPVRNVVDDLEEEEFVAPTKRRTVVDEEKTIVKPATRRTVVAEEEETVAPVKPATRRTVVSDDLEDLEEVTVVRPRKTPVVTSNFDMGEDEDAGVSLKELNEVAGVAPKGVSPKAKSPIVMDDLEEEEVVIKPRRRPVIVDEDDSDDVAPARPVRSGGSFKFD